MINNKKRIEHILGIEFLNKYVPEITLQNISYFRIEFRMLKVFGRLLPLYKILTFLSF